MRSPSLSLALAFAGLLAGAEARAERACAESGKYIAVDTQAHRLDLCSGGAVVESFTVSLGRGGAGHHAQGADRTPEGTYTLAAPRASKRFGTFISFQDDWGLHGPDRRFRWAGSLNTAVDWTRGCVATGSDAEIERIAAWIKRENVRRITLGPGAQASRAAADLCGSGGTGSQPCRSSGRPGSTSSARSRSTSPTSAPPAPR